METERPITMATLLISLIFFCLSSTAYSVGVNYGTLGNNLPSPPQVVNFLKTHTSIDLVKIFDTNPDILRAFSNSGILVTVTVQNGDIIRLANVVEARRWVNENIKPYHPATRINYIAVGNEILQWGTQDMINNLVPSMRSIKEALLLENIRDIRVTSPHSLGMLQDSEQPSRARFRPGWDVGVFAPMLSFLRETKSPLMVNPYPYFSWSPSMENYALFKPNPGVLDTLTGITYTNMFDGMMDAIYSACKALGYPDVDLVIGETGWPSNCEFPVCSVQNARDYNLGLLLHLNSLKGTPLMPKRTFELYFFGLFNENQKPGPNAERNFGLFQPDFTPVYDIGIMTNKQGGGGGIPLPGNSGPKPTNPGVGVSGGKKWCVAKAEAKDQALQANIDYACGTGKVDCKAIQAGGACFEPNDIRSHASFAMNSYYQNTDRQDFSCDFSKTGILTTTNPSHGSCQFI